MQVECELIAQDQASTIPALRAGAYDAIMAGMPITEERTKLIQFSASMQRCPPISPCSRAAIWPPSKASWSAQFDRIEGVEQAALDALERAFAGRTVGVQVATPHASFLEAYLGDVVEIRRSDTPENLDLDLRGAARPGARFDERLTAAAAPDQGAELVLIGPGMTGGPFGPGRHPAGGHRAGRAVQQGHRRRQGGRHRRQAHPGVVRLRRFVLRSQRLRPHVEPRLRALSPSRCWRWPGARQYRDDLRAVIFSRGRSSDSGAPGAELSDAPSPLISESRLCARQLPSLALLRVVREALLGPYVRSPVSHRHARSR